MIQAKGMVSFLESVDEKLKAAQPVLDYYEQLEVDLETKHGTRLAVEVLLREMATSVFDRMLVEKDKHLMKLDLMQKAAEREAQKRLAGGHGAGPITAAKLMSPKYQLPSTEPVPMSRVSTPRRYIHINIPYQQPWSHPYTPSPVTHHRFHHQ